MVNLYIGITDYQWFQFLTSSPNLEEVNFWQPSGRTNFKALEPGELFLFKLHSPEILLWEAAFLLMRIFCLFHWPGRHSALATARPPWRKCVAGLPTIAACWRIRMRTTTLLQSVPAEGVADKIYCLVIRADLGRQGVDGHVADQQWKQALAELFGEQEFRQAPGRLEPARRNKKQHRLAAVGCRFQRVLPALTRRETVGRIKVEENIVPAVGLEPIAQLNGVRVVSARMANEYPRHEAPSKRPSASRINAQCGRDNDGRSRRRTVVVNIKWSPCGRCQWPSVSSHAGALFGAMEVASGSWLYKNAAAHKGDRIDLLPNRIW